MASKPVKPQEEDCCGSGCNPCVFDVYEQQLKLWESKNLPESDPIFNPLKYSSFLLTSIEATNPEVNLYTFQAVGENSEHIKSRIALKMGDFLLLKAILNSKESISRPYTPVINECLKTGSFQAYVKIYPEGKMSQFLEKSAVGDILSWRGPYNKFSLKKADFYVLIGAGTGIVPLYNIARELVLDEMGESLVKIVGCFKNFESVILRKELHDLTDYWNCSLKYFLPENSNSSPYIREEVIYSKLTGECLEQLGSSFSGKKVMFVVCGPDSFNDFCKVGLRGFDESIVVIL